MFHEIDWGSGIYCLWFQRAHIWEKTDARIWVNGKQSQGHYWEWPPLRESSEICLFWVHWGWWLRFLLAQNLICRSLGQQVNLQLLPRSAPTAPSSRPPLPQQGAPGFDRPWDGWGLQGFARLYLSSLIWNLGLLLELSSLSYSATPPFFSFFAKLNYIVSAFAMLSCFIPLFSSLVR